MRLCKQLPIIALIFGIVLLGGCSGGGGDTSVGVSAPPTTPLTALGGEPNSLASGAVFDYDAGDTTTPDEISVSSDGMEIDRTNIEITFVSGTTVEQVNTLLKSIDGEIVSMLKGVSILLVKIPDPGDITTLFQLINQIRSNPVVEQALEARMPAEDSLPGNYEATTSDFSKIDYQLAVLAPAAWNARAAIDYPTSGAPLLLQYDYFGDGVPNKDFDIKPLVTDDFGTGNSSSHGYHVLGIIGGKHTDDRNSTSDRDLVTGMYPATIDVRVVDGSKLNVPASETRIANIIKGSGRKVVVNTSLHSGCPRPPQAACVDPLVYSWLRRIRGDSGYERGVKSEFEKSYIHLTSAGNFRTRELDSRSASVNSQYAAAKLKPGYDFSTIPIPNVTNTLVVENRVNGAAPFAPGCLSPSSKFSGEISAIGDTIWSFSNATSTARDLTGTSMSTPQVAGLAAYIWALKPTLTSDDVVAILTDTARQLPADDAGCAIPPPIDTIPAPVIDAYAAVLAVDDPKLLNISSGQPMDAPARLAIFDVADDSGGPGADRVFDHHDVNAFINNFVASGNTAIRDYSRYDLNGDGFTGPQEGRARFNLDLDADQFYSIVNHNISGSSVVVVYDEDSVTDWEVLCYYAYSPLYTGITDLRDSSLMPYLVDYCGWSSI